MLALTGGTRIYLYRAPTDLRKSFDGLSGLVLTQFGDVLFSGALFVFLNRRRDRVKLLYYDRDGLALWYKRLERGRFLLPTAIPGLTAELELPQLVMLLEGIVPRRLTPRYRRPAVGVENSGKISIS